MEKAAGAGFRSKFRARRAHRKDLRAERRAHRLDRLAAKDRAQGDAFNKSRHTGG